MLDKGASEVEVGMMEKEMERLTRERDEARASAADAWKHAEGVERERSNTVRERDEARDLYAKSQAALREARHELNTFKHEWHERFGYMATRAKPDSIESIDEVACLINERREQDQADHERRRSERDAAEADAASYRDALIHSNRVRRAYNAEIDHLTTANEHLTDEAIRLAEERETLRRALEKYTGQAASDRAADAQRYEWARGEVRKKLKAERDGLLAALEGFFETPSATAEHVVELAQIRHGMTVLEPSAGRGALVKPTLAKGSIVTAIEVLEDNVEALRKLRDAEGANRFAVICGDFELRCANLPLFDRVVMNPPFANRQDAKHVLLAWQLLKPNGRLVAIMSNAVTFRSEREYADVRDLIDYYGSIQPLPEGTFRISGTNINTVIVILNKRS